MKTIVSLLSAVLLFGIVGCAEEPKPEEPEYSRPLPPGELALRKIENPEQIPDFTKAFTDLGPLREATMRSLNYLAKPSSKTRYPYGAISHDHVVASLNAFRELLDSGMTPRQMNAVIRNKFDVYTSVGWNGEGVVLFTGYYTPIFEASSVETAEFRYPLYRAPDNLVKEPDGTVLGRRLPNGAIESFPTRAQIEGSGILAGSELVWLKDPFEVYVAHVQGSALLRMPGGNLVTVGYTASNGHDYRSVAEALIDDGRIPRDEISLARMIAFFDAHPDMVDDYVNRNPRFIFFGKTEGAPRGSINEPVTPMHTIATDKEVYPVGALAYYKADLPMKEGRQVVFEPVSGFALDQDTGGAIRAPGRCDVYIGIGENAGERAGRIKQEGRLYYIFLKLGELEAAGAID